MSLDAFYNEIRRFLASSEAEVLIISGKWGVGKTFAWNKLLIETRDTGRIALDRYAYVSLFGLSGLDDVKSAVFQNTVNRELAGDIADIDTLSGALASATGSWRKGLSFLWSSVTDYAAIMDKIGFFSVRNRIICIDDLERKSQSLDMRDILGLISFLREQRACKIVILLNDEQLAGDETEFRTQLEKVADTAVRFEPSPEEAATIGVDPTTSFAPKLADRCIALGIVNIRTIRKIQKISLRLEEMLGQFDRRVFEQALASAALFVFARNQPDDAPDLEFIRTVNEVETLLDDGAGLPHPDWHAQLQSYGFGHCDEFDLAILEGVKKGHFDQDQLIARATHVQEQRRRQDEDNNFSEAWDLYHDSFDNNADEVIEKILTAIQNMPKSISPLNLSGGIRLLKELGWSGDAPGLIQGYIAGRQEHKHFWDLNQYPFGGQVTDLDVRSAFAAKLETFPETRDAITILRKLGEGRGWNPSDVEFLANQNAHIFYDIFKTARGDDQRQVINGALMFRNIQSAEANMRVVTGFAVEALERIARESPINRLRVHLRGVDIPENESTD